MMLDVEPEGSRMNLFDRTFWVGIIGSRRRAGLLDCAATMAAFVTLIDGINRMHVRIVSGGCPKGGDAFAKLIASSCHIPIVEHLPDKTAHPDLPEPLRSTRQNYDRNTLIARDAADALIACVAPDRKGGTEDTITKWRRLHGDHGKLVIV